MKRENTPSTGASKTSPSPGLTLDSASVWQKRDKPVQNAAQAQQPNWNRYIDSRMKQMRSR
jgi:hypothetical protein